MEDFPTRKITIYHKNKDKYERYVKEASYRNTSVVNHNKNGSNSVDNVLIRFFNLDGYNKTWFIEKEDIIVNFEVEDEIEGTVPITQLSNKYGKDNIHKVTSIDKFIFTDPDIEELEHIKVGCI